MNVVIYRLPAGLSVISPPSRCPTCGSLLTWRENFPIFGWVMLRGRCRRCGIAISSQYMIVEALTGVLFAAIYLAFYVPGSSTPWWNEVGGPWWTFMGPGLSSPAFATLLILLAGLIAMTAIDARTFTIPIQIPVIVTLLAFTGWGVQGFVDVPPRASGLWPIPVLGRQATGMVALGSVGLALSFLLLKLGVFRYSSPTTTTFSPEVPRKRR